jgi:hypothetical protein
VVVEKVADLVGKGQVGLGGVPAHGQTERATIAGIVIAAVFEPRVTEAN